MEWKIRPIEPGDSRELNRLRRMPGVYENIVSYPSERMDIMDRYIANLTDHHHVFVAVTTNNNGEEKIIGFSCLTVDSRVRFRHCGLLGIMVDTDYQGTGIGSKLMESVLDIADNWLMLVRISLVVFADNSRAIGLYEKFGFQTEGVHRMAAIRMGNYCDEMTMARLRPHA